MGMCLDGPCIFRTIVFGEREREREIYIYIEIGVPSFRESTI